MAEETYNTLPDLRFDSGNVVIKLSNNPRDWLVVHDTIVKTHCPVLAPLVKEEWQETTSMVHPSTGEEIKVYKLALRCTDETFVLTDKMSELDSLTDLLQAKVPNQKPAVSIDQSELAPTPWPKPVFGNHSFASNYEGAKTHHKVLLAILYDLPITLESFAGEAKSHSLRTGAPEWMDEMMDAIPPLLVYAEYYGCVPKVWSWVEQHLVEHPAFWHSVAGSPEDYIIFGEKLQSSQIYFGAFRHMVANPNYGYGKIAKALGITAAEALRRFEPSRDELFYDTLQLKDDLQRLQLSKSWATWEGMRTDVRTTFFNATRYKNKKRSDGEKANERADFLARAIYGQCTIGEYVYIFWKRRSERGGPLPAALDKLAKTAKSKDPNTLFGYKIPSRITGIFQMGWKYNPRKQVAAALAEIVQEAAQIVERTFAQRNEQLDDCTILTYRRAKGDVLGEYFAYVGLDENNVPWEGESDRRATGAEQIEVNITEISKDYASVLGL